MSCLMMIFMIPISTRKSLDKTKSSICLKGLFCRFRCGDVGIWRVPVSFGSNVKEIPEKYEIMWFKYVGSLKPFSVFAQYMVAFTNNMCHNSFKIKRHHVEFVIFQMQYHQKDYTSLFQGPQSCKCKRKCSKHNAELQRADPGTKVTG